MTIHPSWESALYWAVWNLLLHIRLLCFTWDFHNVTFVYVVRWLAIVGSEEVNPISVFMSVVLRHSCAQTHNYIISHTHTHTHIHTHTPTYMQNQVPRSCVYEGVGKEGTYVYIEGKLILWTFFKFGLGGCCLKSLCNHIFDAFCLSTLPRPTYTKLS